MANHNQVPPYIFSCSRTVHKNVTTRRKRISQRLLLNHRPNKKKRILIKIWANTSAVAKSQMSAPHLHPKEQPFRASLELQHIHSSCSALTDPLELTVIREYYQILKYKIKTLISILIYKTPALDH